jgi:hypothetical protein
MAQAQLAPAAPGGELEAREHLERRRVGRQSADVAGERRHLGGKTTGRCRTHRTPTDEFDRRE